MQGLGEIGGVQNSYQARIYGDLSCFYILIEHQYKNQILSPCTTPARNAKNRGVLTISTLRKKHLPPGAKAPKAHNFGPERVLPTIFPSHIANEYITVVSRIHHGPVAGTSRIHHEPVADPSREYHGNVAALSRLHHGIIAALSRRLRGLITTSSWHHHGIITPPFRLRHEKLPQPEQKYARFE